MPGPRCAIVVCNNSYVKSNVAPTTRTIVYHKFPENLAVRKIWIHRTRRTGKWNSQHARICSEHFTEDDYERDYESELLHTPRRFKLKSNAVPSQKLGFKKFACNSDRNDRQEKRLRKQLVVELLKAYDETQRSTSMPSAETQDDTQCSASIPIVEPQLEKSSPVLYSNVIHLTSELDNLKQEIRNAEDEVSKLRSQLIEGQQQKVTQNITLNKLQEEVKNLKKKKMPNKILHEKVRDILRPDLTENQIKILLDKKKRVNWHKDEIAQALALMSISKRTYMFLRNKLNYPLPAVSSLHRNVKKFRSGPADAGGLPLDIMALVGEPESSNQVYDSSSQVSEASSHTTEPSIPDSFELD